ncbi:putative SENSORY TRANSDUCTION HISTIDINE KINASE [Vibrio nigripulchritudo SOn1]|uniref:SENSORY TRANSDUCTION HISTIDINE KINASE n=1 Tax=Vibrio nigripulchritudo SOn1 TaxID=1238450 RepID=A0AAV2VYA4_9VIBR|nr:sensor domain-containing diguanylate cyclase [Vibrio nigripulchritudo]CCO49658.1 putative SENSORY TRANSDUCTION HISTIDINE KINASE [Vibrio nigripulchritudo SOn1]
MSHSEYAIILDSELNILGKNRRFTESGLIAPSAASLIGTSLKITWLTSGQVITPTHLYSRESRQQQKVMVESEEGLSEGVIEPISLSDDNLWQIRFACQDSESVYQESSDVFKFRTMLEGSRAGTWEWNVQTGEVVFNERWAEIIGYELEELKPLSIDTWIKHVHEDDLSISEEQLMAHFSGNTPYYECEVRMKHRNGREVWVRDFGKLMTRTPAGDPEWVVGTHIDVTSNKSEAVQLESMNHELDAMIDVSPNVIYRCQGDPLESIDFISKDVSEMTGHHKSEIVESEGYWGKQLPQSVYDEARTEFVQWQKEGRDSVLTRQYRFRHKDGFYLWLSDSVRKFKSPVFNTNGYIGSVADITSQKNLELKLQDSQYRLKTAHQIGRMGHWECNLDTGDVYWSDMVYTILGYERGQVQPSLSFFKSLVAEEHRNRVDESERAAQISGKYDVQHMIKHASGTLIWVHEMADFQVGTNTLIGTIRDITDQKILEIQLREQAITDPLTGAYNRRFYLERLNAEFERFSRAGRSFCLMMIDFDEFKQVNDQHGHLFGDEVLREVAALIKNRLRVNDVFARIGGEEFSVILPDTQLEGAKKVAETIRKQVSTLVISHEGIEASITVTIGLAETLIKSDTMDNLMHRADDLLYEGKKTGRNKVYVQPEEE